MRHYYIELDKDGNGCNTLETHKELANPKMVKVDRRIMHDREKFFNKKPKDGKFESVEET